MKKILLITTLLLFTMTAHAQRGVKGQHSAFVAGGVLNNDSPCYSIQGGYSNYIVPGTLDCDLFYNRSIMKYKSYESNIDKLVVGLGYRHRLCMNYKRTLMLYAGASALVGYVSASDIAPSIILPCYDEIVYGVDPSVRLDVFILKGVALMLRADNMIFIGSELDRFDLAVTFGVKFLIL